MTITAPAPSLFDQDTEPDQVEVVDIAHAPIARLRALFLHASTTKADLAALLVRLESAESVNAALLRSRTGVRSDDPDTSHAAAAGRGATTTFRKDSQRHKLLAVYGQVEDSIGLDDHQAAQYAGLTENRSTCWWKRSSELREVGYIEVSGAVHTDPTSNKDRECCVITDTGRRYLAELGAVT